ncbi:tyrosine-type recombinase/integrase [Natronorubrum halophilum]|uniref:tyrosine-type recombinase/integrase n=1 Tax=Natronorubrum halophilum TaxID=1702106 RepID=UPI0010C17629|nr:tyrosine-type recombinase/integrase [Natronorubrum halophilum]
MTEKAAEKIERLRDRIEEGEEISDADHDVLMEFSDQLYLLSSRYSNHRHEHLLRRCTRMAEEVGSLADTLDDRDATEDLVRWIHRTYDNEETNRDYRGSLRVFAKHVTDGDEIPDTVSWVPGSTSRNYKPAPKPGDMLKWEDDILPMIDAARYSRNKAIIAVAWDSGARSGEFRDLTIGDVSDHDRGLQITVDGKTGQRTITLIPSVPYLQRWLEDHPTGDDPSAPLWTKLHSADGISYNMYRKILEGAAEDADVRKPVTLTNFRKSSASYLANMGVNQAVLEEHHGWARGSKVASRYISVFADASDREIARAHGVDVEVDKPDPTGPVECPRCGKDTPRSEDFCMWCHQALEHGALDDIQEAQRDKRAELLQFAKNHPEFIDRVEDMEPVIEMFDGDPELISLARKFVDVTNN